MLKIFIIQDKKFLIYLITQKIRSEAIHRTKQDETKET